MEFITIESHFGVPENCIRANTRNKCSEDLVEIINQIARIIYSQDEFEICLIPPKAGSYTDIIKIVKKEFKKNPVLTTGAAVGTLATLGTLAVAVLTYNDSHSEHLQDEKVWEIEDAAKCLALREQIIKLSEEYEVEGISEEKLQEVCGDIHLKKLKNDRYKILEGDETVASDATILKNSAGKILLEKKIERNDFPSYIEALPEEEGIKENNEGVIELISLVVKQQKDGKGIPWKGTYYGDDIMQNGEVLLVNEELINFFMQDETFKQKIKNKEVAFGSGDNISVKFKMSFSKNLDGTWSKTIYVTDVEKFNEVVIEHQPKHKKNIEKEPPENQLGLFA